MVVQYVSRRLSGWSRTRRQIGALVATLCFLATGFKPLAADAAAISFNRDIRPILSDNCYACHGPDADNRKGKLRLDTREAAVAEARSGEHPVVPGHPLDSEIITRVTTSDEDDLMPPPDTGKKLTKTQIDLLKQWIQEGAPYETHWAFVRPTRPEPPTVAETAWPKNAIDQFILSRLEKEGVKPSPEADRVTLIRRVSLDLTGLPPTIAEVEAFVADPQPDAYDRLVQRLLDSPHYGERWGKHWLDVARYADSNGYSIDAPRQIWKYRDWVIDAMNDDLPYDQFVVEQLAGDLLPNATLEQKVATGFHRNTQINEEGGIDKEQFRIESIIDRVSTTGTAFLGLTLACSQCHDHKFDPLPQKDFYGMFAFFNNAEEPNLSLATSEEIAKADAIEGEIADYIAKLPQTDTNLLTSLAEWEKDLPLAQRQAMPEHVRLAFDVKPDERTEKHRTSLLTAFVEKAPQNKKLQATIKGMRSKKPKFPTTMVMRELPKPRRTYLFVKGDFTRDGGTVEPSVPGVLHPLAKSATTNRLDFAKWLIDPANPLTSRVTVNRIWQQYFGRGIVETENDFGTQGIPPTHPELLDWLAIEFLQPSAGSEARPWSMKHMHKLIVTSATYRQSSRIREDLSEIDPLNKFLARQSRLRLDAEIVRDVSLSASGLLDKTIGGPSVFPPQPDGVMNLGQSSRAWKPDADGDRYRRGLYTHFWRATPHPALAVFDAPDTFATCTRRLRSNTPLQALTLLNDPQFFEMARAFAARVLKEVPADNHKRMEHAFRLCVSREHTPGEKQILDQLLAQVTAESGQSELAAWTAVSRTLLNLDETITRE